MARTRTAVVPSPTLPADGWGADLISLSGPSGPSVRVRRGPHHWLQADCDDEPDPALASQLHCALRRGVPPTGSPMRAREIVVVGDGPTAEAVARRLIAHPTNSVVLGRDPTHPAERPADWQTALLAERRPGRRPARWTDAHPEDAWRPGSLVVVSTASAEPDRVLVHRLAQRGADHLVVRVHQGVALVGPWVTPGRTPCLQCHDHWLADHDTGYARVLNDLEQRPAVTDASSLSWAAAVVGRLAGSDAGRQALGGRIEVSDLLFPTLRGFAVVAHPSCRCRIWAQAAATI